MNRFAPIPRHDPRPADPLAFVFAMLEMSYGRDVAEYARRCHREQATRFRQWNRRQSHRDLLASLELQLAESLIEFGPDHRETTRFQRRVDELRARCRPQEVPYADHHR